MDRVRLRDSEPGEHHSAYLDDERRLVVEWYETSDHGPYEHATMVVFDAVGQEALALALGLTSRPAETAALLALIEERFSSYFEVRTFAEENGLPYSHEVDFNP
jgi:hypothetical protein